MWLVRDALDCTWFVFMMLVGLWARRRVEESNIVYHTRSASVSASVERTHTMSATTTNTTPASSLLSTSYTASSQSGDEGEVMGLSGAWGCRVF